MGKKAKEHRLRVAKRNQRIADEKKRMEKMARNFLENLIQRENESGKFNNPVQPFPTFDGMNPNLGLPNSGPFLGMNMPFPTPPTNESSVDEKNESIEEISNSESEPQIITEDQN